MSYSHQTPEAIKEDERFEETLLRATLSEHAPQSIDSDQAWIAYRRLLMAQTQVSAPQGKLLPLKQRHPSALRRWYILAAIAALLVMVLGINLINPGLMDGNQQAHAESYTQIHMNQVLQSQNITMSVAYAFANLDQIDVQAAVHFPANVNIATVKFNHVMLSYQNKPLLQPDDGNFIVFVRKVKIVQEPTFIVLTSINHSPVNPPAGNEISLTWTIPQISYTDTAGHVHTVNVHWILNFTTPFYHDHNDIRPFSIVAKY